MAGSWRKHVSDEMIMFSPQETILHAEGNIHILPASLASKEAAMAASSPLHHRTPAHVLTEDLTHHRTPAPQHSTTDHVSSRAREDTRHTADTPHTRDKRAGGGRSTTTSACDSSLLHHACLCPLIARTTFFTLPANATRIFLGLILQTSLDKSQDRKPNAKKL